jgi:hypothetical protein
MRYHLKKKKGRGMAQVVKHLPSKCKTLSSKIPCLQKKGERKKGREGRREGGREGRDGGGREEATIIGGGGGGVRW